MIIISSGNVGKVDFKVNDNGMAFLTVSIADEEYDSRKKESVTNWVNAKWFGKGAEALADTINKAQSIQIVGKEQYRIYQDKIIRDVVVNDFKILSWKPKKDKNAFIEGQPIDIQDDDLPF